MDLRFQRKAIGQQTDAWQSNALGVLVCQTLLSKASLLARKGEYATAEGLLKQLVGSDNEDTGALDLLARIHAQQGRFSEAEAFWKHALQLAPNNESYLAGLKRIAHIRSRPLWVGVLLPMGAAFVAILMISLVGFAIRDQIVQVRESLLREGVRENPAPLQVVPPGDPNFASEITIQLRGATVKTQENALVVLLDDGLFLYGANLKPEAETLLSELGRHLKPYGSNISIRVVGHTDDIPVPEGRVYRDNAALGMTRAMTVAKYLSHNAGLPMNLFQLQSAGEFQPPYPNDTRANRLRNRTAIIRIYNAENIEGSRP